MSDLADKIRGMILLAAYGDSFGAKHELADSVHDEPFPDRIPAREIGNHHWGTWLPASMAPIPARGVPTDDTAFKLFILYPWMQDTFEYGGEFDEESFKTFIAILRGVNVIPDWVKTVRNAQISDWLKMYAAEANNTSFQFFEPDIPVVFGFFMFLELGAIRFNKSIVENYLFFKNFTALDQSYGKSATGFLCTLLSSVFNADNSQKFHVWLQAETKNILEILKNEGVDPLEINILDKMTSSMLKFGEKYVGRSSHDFMIEFEKEIINKPKPPFMDSSFLGGVFDPFRFIAEIYASIAFAQGDPYVAIRTVSFGSGDTDTVATFMGTIMGAWYGHRALRKEEELLDDLRDVQRVLSSYHKFNIREMVQLFIKIYEDSSGGDLV